MTLNMDSAKLLKVTLGDKLRKFSANDLSRIKAEKVNFEEFIPDEFRDEKEIYKIIITAKISVYFVSIPALKYYQAGYTHYPMWIIEQV